MARNRHHDMVMDDYYCAAHTWEMLCEEVAIGYKTEIAEFKQTHPRPLLKDFLILHSHREP